MGRKKSKKPRRRNKRPAARGSAAPRRHTPEVHVRLAIAGSLDDAATLVKPAILYADKVTIYSPVASMVSAIRQFAATSDPRERAALMLAVMAEVPGLTSQVDMNPEAFAQLQQFLTLDPQLVRSLSATAEGSQEIDAFYEQIDALGPIWEDAFPDAIRQVEENVGGGDLMTAIDEGAVVVADLSVTPSHSVVAEAVNAGLEESQADDLPNELLVGFTSRIVEILSDARSFPLLDADTSGLLRAFEVEAGLRPSQLAMRHRAEITSATEIMGFLPSFPNLPMDELLDLRSELAGPLQRFRSEWSLISREFSTRPFDSEFSAEVEDAWRTRVEPALQEIRETLSEHGLLREAASIALGDPRRILVEAGGVVAAAHTTTDVLSGLMTAGLAVSVPAADVMGRAVRARAEARRGVRKHPFYFLHRVAEASTRD